jgi:hypothetical protein
MPRSRLLQPLICTLGLIYFAADIKVVEFMSLRSRQWVLLLPWDLHDAAGKLLRLRRNVVDMRLTNQVGPA